MAAISAVACLFPLPPAEYVTLMKLGSSFASSSAMLRADSMLSSPFGGKISNEIGWVPALRACAKMFVIVFIMRLIIVRCFHSSSRKLCTRLHVFPNAAYLPSRTLGSSNTFTQSPVSACRNALKHTSVRHNSA